MMQYSQKKVLQKFLNSRKGGVSTETLQLNNIEALNPQDYNKIVELIGTYWSRGNYRSFVDQRWW